MVSVDRTRTKRSRLNQDEHDPMSEILADVESNSVAAFQRLLFIIDYHWSVLHGDLQKRVDYSVVGSPSGGQRCRFSHGHFYASQL